MSMMSNERRRGFMRVSEHQAQELERWAYPDYSNEGDILASENAFNYDHQCHLEQQQPEPEHELEPIPAPLTAAELEAMQQSAYDEGVEQGRQAGHSEGFTTGHAEGITAGHDEGLAQGLQQGLEQGQAQIDHHVAMLVAVMDKFADPIAKVDSEVEQQLLLLVNGMGATPLSELYLIFNSATKILQQQSLHISRSLVGNFTTALDMAGASITICVLDEEIKKHWDSPVLTASLRWGI